jgi:hypothetical protein
MREVGHVERTGDNLIETVVGQAKQKKPISNDRDNGGIILN